MNTEHQFKLDHAVLRVSDFGQACSFYRVLFGYMGWHAREEYLEEPSVGFQQLDGFTVWLESVGELTTGRSAGWLDHLAFHCSSRDEVHQSNRQQ